MELLFFQFELNMAVHAALTKKKICEVNELISFGWLFVKNWLTF